jgi:hypothetical protein
VCPDSLGEPGFFDAAAQGLTCRHRPKHVDNHPARASREAPGSAPTASIDTSGDRLRVAESQMGAAREPTHVEPSAQPNPAGRFRVAREAPASGHTAALSALWLKLPNRICRTARRTSRSCQQRWAISVGEGPRRDAYPSCARVSVSQAFFLGRPLPRFTLTPAPLAALVAFAEPLPPSAG